MTCPECEEECLMLLMPPTEVVQCPTCKQKYTRMGYSPKDPQWGAKYPFRGGWEPLSVPPREAWGVKKLARQMRTQLAVDAARRRNA